MSVTTAKQRWTGKSGKTYEYYVHKVGDSFKKQAGNYIFCKRNAAGNWVPQYIGQAKNLDERLGNHEQEACAKRNGATHIHAHLNPVETNRLAEEKDLILNFRPPCNTQHAG